MKKNTIAMLLSTVLLVPAAAFAAGGETGFYAGGGYSLLMVDPDGTTDDANLGAVFLRGGYQLNENLSFEARVGGGVKDDDIEDTNIETEYIYGAYLKAGAPTEFGLYPYILAGWTDTKLKYSEAGESDTDVSGSLSYGLGADYYFNANISAGVEYTEYYNKDDGKIGGLTIAMNYKF